ncbi:hypothetical protein [Celeribacter sp. SCSIO 80788]|uniref:hypothetical protein n=1 Tax=Celeribacter sp. SCSIO 80788 TaxID=3117013 RepID=UPI003DA38D90
MGKRRRLSNAIKRAAAVAGKHQAAQDELHSAFFEVYGFDLEIEELGGESWTDALVYGHSSYPSISDFDAAVKMLKDQTNDQ